ncbi:MAG: TrmH family RNA methyltransferase [Eubacterium sp.]
MIITSNNNDQIKSIVQLQESAKARELADTYVVEGLKMVKEAPKELVKKIFVSEAYIAKNKDVIDINNPKVQIVAEKVYKKVTDTVSPQGILALVAKKHYNLDEMIYEHKQTMMVTSELTSAKAKEVFRINNLRKNFLLIDRVQDPGNLGTIVRTAEGAGIAGVIISDDSVDLFNPKTIRSTMGSVYRMPYIVTDSLLSVIDKLQAEGLKVYASTIDGNISYEKPKYNKTGVGFVVGNESNGVSDMIVSRADDTISIPMSGQVESLNVAVASSILMYKGRC